MNSVSESVSIFKEVMGSYPTGVTVVTSIDENGAPVGLTVNSFASVSLEPLLVLWSIDHRVSSLDVFKNTNKFAIHILADDQKELCWNFSKKDIDRFSTCSWELSNDNLPVISDAFAVIECETYKQIEAGDHTIFIGKVLNIQKHDKDPMLYFRRNIGAIPSGWSE